MSKPRQSRALRLRFQVLRRNQWHIACLILLASILSQTIAPMFADQTYGHNSRSSPLAKGLKSASAGECVVNSTMVPWVVNCSANPIEDAYVDNLSPTLNFGDFPVLIVQDTPSIPKSRNYAYLKFDASSALPLEILLSHAKPENVTLELYVRLTLFSENASVGVYAVTNNTWTEKALNWDNRPAFDPADYTARDITFNGTWYAWNATKQTSSGIEEGSQVSLAVVPTSNAWRNYVWFDSREYSPSGPSTWPTLRLLFVEPYLSMVTPFPHMLIEIDNQTYETNEDGGFGAYLPWGSYTITVPEEIAKGDGVRERFVGWSDNVTDAARRVTLGNNFTLTPVYKTQYFLNVSSPYSSTIGGGWYFRNAMANASVESTVVPAEGLLGLLGVRRVFDHWTGDCAGAQSTCTVAMTGPKSVLAVWRIDYMISEVLAGSLLVLLSILIAFRRRKRKLAGRWRSRRSVERKGHRSQ